MTTLKQEPSNYTWSQFLGAVYGLLTVDLKRVGSSFTTWKLAVIRQAVTQLQNLVEQYQVNHETIYGPQDTVLEGRASRFVKPPQSIIRNIYLAQTCQDQNSGDSKCNRWECDQFPWSDRFALVKGMVPLNAGRGKFAIDPQGYTAYVYPAVYDCWVLSVHWDGVKIDFQDAEETPFDEACAGAVAWFLKAHIALEVERSVDIFNSYMRQYEIAKRLCFGRERDKTQSKDKP
jgi:hypothetical protein